MNINILDESIIFENKNSYPAFPSIIKLDNNRFLISFRNAPKIKKHYSHLHSLSKAMLAVFDINKNGVEKVFEFGDAGEILVNRIVDGAALLEPFPVQGFKLKVQRPIGETSEPAVKQLVQRAGVDDFSVKYCAVK